MRHAPFPPGFDRAKSSWPRLGLRRFDQLETAAARAPEKNAGMTSTQKALVQQTFAQLAPIADQAASLFYGRLFQVDPSLRPLFKGDMTAQGKKLMQMIGFCVGKLDALDEIVPAVKQLGQRHAGYGVTPAHYDTVAGALLWTLE